MSIRTAQLLFASALFGPVCGCAVTTVGDSNNSYPAVIQLYAVVEPRHLDPNVAIQESGLSVGDYCRVDANMTGIPSPDDRSDGMAMIAGRVAAIDENRIVLDDVVSISKKPGPAVGVPTSTKIMGYLFYGPFAPRLFKNTGTGHKSIPVDGEVVVDRSTLRMVQPVDGTNWDDTRHTGQWFERIGISFEETKPQTHLAQSKSKPSSLPDSTDEFSVSPAPPAKAYDPAAEMIQSSSFTTELKQPPARQPYMSVEAINGGSR